ncbi:MAG: two-component sensor histidine kinase [Ideonella sp. MAG2]|nr:MAG: two-component sensor histidine kinase [Ideonella sp. MAG2]
MRAAFARIDTLALRLFCLMWLALVLSHMAAWGWTHWQGLGFAAEHSARAGMPPPERAPPPGPPGQQVPHRPPPPPHAAAPMLPTFPSLPPMATQDSPGLPTPALLQDYAVRLLMIAMASWWGAQWLARPMRQLSAGASHLSQALSRGEPPVQLDEHQGTREVRQGATAFNHMAAQLKQQFDERGLMVAAMSHDLRTPLTRLRVRMENPLLPAELRERSISDLRDMSTLIETVLEVFSLKSKARQAMQRVELRTLLQALADDATELGQEVQLLPGDTAVLQTDALAVRRIVGNLVSNAVRYGQRARISVSPPMQGRVCIRVEDDGPGIEPALQAQVLQPFVRLEGSRNRDTGGMGLGLYIARELTLGLGGELRLGNREAGGLWVEVHLQA